MPSEFEIGLLTGILVGEGHFGGDGRQPQITLRMHVRHEAMFRWLERTFPGGKLYGPYNHDGRHYFQWMARGPYLRDYLVPLLEPRMSPDLDAHSYQRFQEMQLRYAKQLRGGPADQDLGSAPDPSPTSTSALGREPLGQPATPAGAPSSSRQVASIFDELRRSQPT